MELTFGQSVVKATITTALQRHYVEITPERNKDITKLLSKLDFNEEYTEILFHLINEVAVTNYQLGAERQKSATFENVYRVIKELENK